MNRPTFTGVIAALRYRDPRFPWVGPTAEEADVADALEIHQDHHQPAHDEPDPDGMWGECSACGEPWPCAVWNDGEHLALQWLTLAADRVHAHAMAVTVPPATRAWERRASA